MANEEHLRILKSGVQAWNDWREGNPDVEPDLSGAVLQGMKLEDAQLQNVDFTGADIRSTNFSGSNLRNSKFINSKTGFSFRIACIVITILLVSGFISGIISFFSGALIIKIFEELAVALWGSANPQLQTIATIALFLISFILVADGIRQRYILVVLLFPSILLQPIIKRARLGMDILLYVVIGMGVPIVATVALSIPVVVTGAIALSNRFAVGAAMASIGAIAGVTSGSLFYTGEYFNLTRSAGATGFFFLMAMLCMLLFLMAFYRAKYYSIYNSLYGLGALAILSYTFLGLGLTTITSKDLQVESYMTIYIVPERKPPISEFADSFF